MPKPILLAACDKVILDTDGLVSLITLIEKLEIKIPSNIDLPVHTSIPMRWSILAVWSDQKTDEGTYEQMTEVALADGTIAMHSVPEVIQQGVPSSTGAKMISTLTAVPVTNGSIEVRLHYRKVGDPKWIQAATYPIEIILVRS